MKLPAPLPASVVSAFVATAFAGSLAAQINIPPGAMPLVPPPVDHPALLGQPAWTSPPASERPDPPAPTPGQAPNGAMNPGGPTGVDPAELRAREFLGKRVAGRDLKDAVDRVGELKWHKKLLDARAAAASRGQPILWLQSLGDLEGFA
jgi:hypothetical protein